MALNDGASVHYFSESDFGGKLEDSLLGILILHRRTLRAFEPADYVLHLFSFVPNGLTDRNRLKSAPSAVGAGNKPFVEKPFLSLARIGSGM
jgi:hypothetical protein